jgi:N-acetyl-gamma-glutamyl-phosphate reductase
VSEDWIFGFAEMEPGQYERIAAAKRVSNPGCYSTGFIALVRPLVRAGIIPADWPLSAAAVSGYSGGGKSMIEEFEDRSSPRYVNTIVRTYALTLAHKHTPEMMRHAGLSHPPIFSPMVGRFYRGMLVDVPLPLWALPGAPTVKTVHDALKEAYLGRPLVEVAEFGDGSTEPALDAEALKNTNKMRLYVFGNEAKAQVRLVALLDNLGKGASGAAVQNLNIMLGLAETAGLA